MRQEARPGPLSALLDRASLRSISVVIPAHNEEENLGVVLDACRETLAEVGDCLEVVIVDNASSDDTVEIASAYAEEDHRFRVVRQPRNVGPAASILDGLRASTGDAAVVLPADRQIMPDQVAPCLAALQGHDLVWTRRVQRADPPHRRMAAGAYNTAVRFLFRVPVHDIDSCFLVRRAVIDAIGPRVVERSNFIPVEFLVRALRANLRVTEVPIEHHPRVAGKQEGLALSDTLRALVSLVHFWVGWPRRG